MELQPLPSTFPSSQPTVRSWWVVEAEGGLCECHGKGFGPDNIMQQSLGTPRVGICKGFVAGCVSMYLFHLF